MGKKRNSSKKKPSYYNSKRLTVGMMEDICRNIQNKNLPILVSDKTGSSPESGLRAVLLAKSHMTTGVVVCGKFNWTTNDDEDDEEDDDVDDDDMTLWDHVASGNVKSCANDETPVDCVEVDGARLVYLGDSNDKP